MSGKDGTVWYLRIQEEDLGDVVVLRLEGRVYSSTSADLAQALDRICDAGGRAVVVDMSAVDYINGQGLSVIEAATTRFRLANRPLIAFGLCPAVGTTFDLSGALEHVIVEPSFEAALRRASRLNGS